MWGFLIWSPIAWLAIGSVHVITANVKGWNFNIVVTIMSVLLGPVIPLIVFWLWLADKLIEGRN